MDTQVVKTFLEVALTGSFGHAASRLNVGQTTVSARIRKLEEQLGQTLFDRRKSGAELTLAGRQFLRLAPSFVQLGERLTREVLNSTDHTSVLSIGFEVSLARNWVISWLHWLRQNMPETAIHLKVDIPVDLIRRVSDGLLDAAIMHAPPHRSGITVEKLGEDHLAMYTTDPSIRSVQDPRFIYVDWGPVFAQEFKVRFPNFREGPVSIDFPPLAERYIMKHGGAAYGRQSVAKPYVEAKKIVLVQDAPRFAYPIYAVRPIGANIPHLDQALSGLPAISLDDQAG